MAPYQLIVVLITTVLIGCAHQPAASKPGATQTDRQCAPFPPPTLPDTAGTERARKATPADGKPFSPRTKTFAEVLKLEDVLGDLAGMRSEGRKDSIELLRLRQQIDERLFLTVLQVSGAVAEIACERDRADESADRMDEIDTRRVKGLTLASIMIGGVASMVSGALGLAGVASTPADAATLSGGFLESLFGGTALFTKSSQEFRHERNVLREIWDDTVDRRFLPDVIWRFLDGQHPRAVRTFREELMANWRQEGRLGHPDSKDEEHRRTLIFGAGGRYTAKELRIRSAMLEELQATINLINEELAQFAQEVLRELTG